MTEWDNIFNLTESNRRAMALSIEVLRRENIEII